MFREGKSPVLAVARAGEFGRTMSTGVFDPNLICARCENRFSTYDRYAKEFFLDRDWGGDDASALSTQKRLLAHPCDYAKLKLFFLNLLWRAGASMVRPFNELDLGAHLDRIRDFLDIEDAGSADDYAVFAVRLVGEHHEIKDLKPERIIFAPWRSRVDHVNVVQFVFGGFNFIVKVDERPFPPAVRAFQLMPGSDFRAIVEDFTASPLSAAVQRVARNDTRDLD